MRGSLALAGPALLIVYMVAVNFGGPVRELPNYLLGWWIAVVVSTVAGLLLLPRDHRLDVRAALADCLETAANVVAVGWDRTVDDSDRNARIQAFRDAVAALDRLYQGQPFRPSGAAGRDRALTLLVEHVHAAQLLLASTRAEDVDPATGIPTRTRPCRPRRRPHRREARPKRFARSALPFRPPRSTRRARLNASPPSNG